ncbi:efflux RND transporter periplasmic adaptor subunit [uncultured Marivita sp.]|uniref:efflux RND transporter periplasmic adaptor subunit n=2 Tax=unclassified Marivita TaxID=2632480 RepID=UPI000D7911ED|nr:MAG: efflux RND transporter periplasmic adaptor subunit [Marivita sp. XM-24bin2]
MRMFFRCATLIIFSMLPALVAAQGRPAGVSTALVTTSTMAETVSVFGEVVAGRESAVAARVSGVAQKVPIRVGDLVAQGDILARLDTELLQIELAQAEAQIAIAQAGVSVAEARLDRSEKSFRRAETLRENSTIAEAQLEERASDYAEATGTLQEALARIKSAENALEQARYRLKNAVVRAPFDAVVLNVATEVGQFITVGSQVATLIDTSALEIEANVPARFVSALRNDEPVEATTDIGDTLSLMLRAVLPTEFAATRTRPVRFRVEDEDAAIAVGQTVSLDVPVSEAREVLVVPKDALVQSQGGWSVFVNQDGKAMPRPVEIGAALNNAFEVLTGLSEGDEVVIRGNERLRPGQDIAPTGAPKGAESNSAPKRAESPEAGESKG